MPAQTIQSTARMAEKTSKTQRASKAAAQRATASISVPEGAPAQPIIIPIRPLDNRTVAGILYEVADLMEIDGADSFRVRSYRRAAEAIEAQPGPVSEICNEPKKLLEIPGIG